MRHADSLAWDWWKDPPDSVGQKANYLLNKEELEFYCRELFELHELVQGEGMRVKALLRAYEKGRVPSYEHGPQPVTLGTALNLMLGAAKHKLAIMQMLTAMVQDRNKKLDAEQVALRG